MIATEYNPQFLLRSTIRATNARRPWSRPRKRPPAGRYCYRSFRPLFLICLASESSSGFDKICFRLMDAPWCPATDAGAQSSPIRTEGRTGA